jgi:Uma2 family endonuclease
MTELLERELNSALTWAEYLALPYETRNMDLVDGRVIVNAPGPNHERVVRRLLIEFQRWADDEDAPGEFSTQQPVGIEVDRGYQPDLSWWPEECCSQGNDDAAYVGLPSIVVEVLSPSTRARDRVRKRDDYERIGIAEYWIIDPVKRTAVLRRRSEAGAPFDVIETVATDEIITSPLLPGFSVVVGELFRRR